MKKLLLVLLLAGLLLPSAALAADDVPTLAFLRFGQSPSFRLTDKGVLDVLQAYGFISDDERATLDSGSGDLRGENLNILYRDAGFDLATASLMVEDALDEGADVMITISTQVGMLAANAMREYDDPPVMIFAIVTVPFEVGIAQAPCVKEPNVTGTQMDLNFALVEEVRAAQVPDLEKFGMIIFPNDPTSALAIETLSQYADMMGITMETVSALTPADFPLATQSLVDKGVEAIIIPPSTGSRAGVTAIAENAYGIPIFSNILTDVFLGATIGAGFQGWYSEGAIAGRMAAHYMNGDLDIASTGINLTKGFGTAVNLDAADLQGVEIRDEMLTLANFVILGGTGFGEELEIPGVNTFLEDLSPEERMEKDAAFLADLRCTPEMIAEQMAALEG